MHAEQEPRPPVGRTNDEAGKAEERRVIAVHEAGHAVAQIALGLGKLKQVVLTVTEKGGYVSYSAVVTALTARDQDCACTKSETDAIAGAVVCMAGYAAEHRYCVEIGIHDNSVSGAMTDRLNAIDRIRTGFSQEPADILPQVIARAERLMERSDVWRAVTALSDELNNCWPEEQKRDGERLARLDGETAEKLIREKLERCEPASVEISTV